jgi:phosphosulfolactate phosphohydrolase-like enzyme
MDKDPKECKHENLADRKVFNSATGGVKAVKVCKDCGTVITKTS